MNEVIESARLESLLAWQGRRVLLTLFRQEDRRAVSKDDEGTRDTAVSPCQGPVRGSWEKSQ